MENFASLEKLPFSVLNRKKNTNCTKTVNVYW